VSWLFVFTEHTSHSVITQVACDKKPKQDIYPTAIIPKQSMTHCCSKMFFMDERGSSLL
jgi:hypothetical protein